MVLWEPSFCKSGLNGISHGVPTRSDCRVPCLEHLCHFGANSRNWRPASLNLVLGCRNQQKGRESIKPHPQLLMANASRPSGPGRLNIENHSGHCAFSEEASRSTCYVKRLCQKCEGDVWHSPISWFCFLNLWWWISMMVNGISHLESTAQQQSSYFLLRELHKDVHWGPKRGKY